MSQKINFFKKIMRFKKSTSNNERVYKSVRFSQNVCVIKEVVVPINELVTKNVRFASGFIIIIIFYKIDVRYS